MNVDIYYVLSLYRPNRAIIRILYDNRPAILYKRRYIYRYICICWNEMAEYEIFDYYRLRTIMRYYIDRLFDELFYNNAKLSYEYINGYIKINYYITGYIRVEISYKTEHIVCALFYNDTAIQTNISEITANDITIYDMIYERINKKLI